MAKDAVIESKSSATLITGGNRKWTWGPSRAYFKHNLW